MLRGTLILVILKNEEVPPALTLYAIQNIILFDAVVIVPAFNHDLVYFFGCSWWGRETIAFIYSFQCLQIHVL